jgi:hypothetical protein
MQLDIWFDATHAYWQVQSGEQHCTKVPITLKIVPTTTRCGFTNVVEITKAIVTNEQRAITGVDTPGNEIASEDGYRQKSITFDPQTPNADVF